MESNKNYLEIIKHYESCLERYGDTHLGVDWPNEKDAQIRYKIMLEVIRDKRNNVSLLDFGCGTSHLYEYMQMRKFPYVEYSGLDISRKYIDIAQKKYPDIKYYCLDIMDDFNGMPEVDYVIMNGVFTEKRELSFDEMWVYFQRLLINVFVKVRFGVAFNVMSKQVDWEREDLFHLSMDILSKFLRENISRHWVFRNDYGLYEYTVYIYKLPDLLLEEV